MTTAEQLRLYRRGAYAAEVLQEIEATLKAHPAETEWFVRAAEDVQAATLHRLQEVDDVAHATEARLALVPIAGGAR